MTWDGRGLLGIGRADEECCSLAEDREGKEVGTACDTQSWSP